MATTIKILLNEDRVTKSGLYPLVIRVTHKRRKKMIYSPYRLRPEEFNKVTQKVIWAKDSALSKSRVNEINRYVAKQIQEMTRLVDHLEHHRKDEYTIDDFVTQLKRHSQDRYFFYYIDREIASKHRTGRFGTSEIYTSCRNSVQRFVGSRNITFKDINYRFVSDYIDHLRERQLSENTIHMYLRNFRSVYNKARKEGLVSPKIYPFIDIKMSGTKTVKRALSKDAMKRIANLDLSDNKIQEGVRDIFMFSFYTRGMSLIDIINLKHKDIEDGYIHYVRNKTSQLFRIALTPQIRTLIKKYRSDQSEYVWPYLEEDSSESLYRQYRRAMSGINLYLKIIGKLAGIDKPLTSYVARHTWASIAKTEGIPVAAISEGLGHTTEKTTQIYLRAFDQSTIDKINAKISVL